MYGEYLMTGDEKNISSEPKDPTKKEIWRYIDTLEYEQLIELRGILKMFKHMTLKPQIIAKKETGG